MKIWDQGFGLVLKGGNAFRKSNSFANYERSEEAVKRVLFQYDM